MPRAGLSRTRVVAEAGVLAEQVGLDRLTLAELAARLGVRQPSLYKHVDSIGDLRRGMAVEAKHQLVEVLVQAAVGRSGREAIRGMSHAYRDWALQHPAGYRSSMVMPAPGDAEHEAAALAAVQVIGDVLRAFALEGDDAIDAIRAFRATLHGFVALETEGSFALAVDVERSFDRLIDGFTVALDSWAGPTSGQAVSSSSTASP